MIEQTFKILVTGPYAAGKTSLIQSVSQTQVISTDVATSGDEADVKANTTVAMDFGTYSIEDDDVRLLLFGTPGQPRFRFMTNILKGDVDIVAFVIDAEAKETHAPAGVELRSMMADLQVPAVIAVNRCDDLAVAQRIARSIGASPDHPVVPCQLNEPDSGRTVIVEILVSLLSHIETSRVRHERRAPELT
jgi:small GTP-binding protein